MAFKPFRIVIITDISLGVDSPQQGQYKILPSRALSLLRYVLTRLNNEMRPAFVVQLGNLIEAEDQEEDEETYSKGIEAFKQLSMPVYHAVGSNEQVNLNQKQISSMLKYSKLYYSFDSEAFHFVVLFSSSKDRAEIHIDEEQRNWLAEDLNATLKPTLVFSHHPLDEQDLSDNFCFEQYPTGCFVEERQEIRAILARSGKVRAVFSGHVHRNNLQEHDGIHYVSLQSLVTNMSKTGKTTSESFAVIELSENEISIEIEGLDPAEYRLWIAR